MIAIRLVLVAGALLVGAPAAAQLAVPPLTPEQAQTADQAMSRLRSPYTGSHTVDMCPSAGALRDTIRFAAASGQSTVEIVEATIARHGEQIRLLPKRRGAGLLAWVATPFVILLGGALIVRRFSRRPPAEVFPIAGVSEEVSDADRVRLAEAMRELESVEP